MVTCHSLPGLTASCLISPPASWGGHNSILLQCATVRCCGDVQRSQDALLLIDSSLWYSGLIGESKKACWNVGVGSAELLY